MLETKYAAVIKNLFQEYYKRNISMGEYAPNVNEFWIKWMKNITVQKAQGKAASRRMINYFNFISGRQTIFKTASKQMVDADIKVKIWNW